jgi:hypothetical protein
MANPASLEVRKDCMKRIAHFHHFYSEGLIRWAGELLPPLGSRGFDTAVLTDFFRHVEIGDVERMPVCERDFLLS